MADWDSTMSVTVSVDASELERDLERIEDGELELPTVSAVHIHAQSALLVTLLDEELPLWLFAA
jgi:hypothetical protein